jgi:hypothetical protein
MEKAMDLLMKSLRVKRKVNLCLPYRKQRCCIGLTGGLNTTVVRHHYGIKELTTRLNENPEQPRDLSAPEG